MTVSVRTVAALVLSVVTALGVVIGAREVFAATTVSPSNMNGWVFNNNSGSDIGEFVTGPGTPPSGMGSAHLLVGADNGEVNFSRLGYSGVKLGQITSFNYYAYEPVTDDPSRGLLMVRLQVSTEFGSDTLVFIPRYQSQVPEPHVWQQWNALNGYWRSVEFAGFAGGTVAEYLAFLALYSSVEPYIVDYPDVGYGGIQFVRNFQAGEESYVDTFTIGVSGMDTTYDFEPDVPTTPTSTLTPTATFTATSTPTPTPTATATPCPGACPPTSTFTPTATHVSVGGIAEQPDVSALPSVAASSNGNYAVYILGVAGAILAALGACAWAMLRRRRVS